MTNVGSSKIALVRLLREVTGLSITEVDALLGQVPVVVRDSVDLVDAEDLQARLASAGATVEIR